MEHQPAHQLREHLIDQLQRHQWILPVRLRLRTGRSTAACRISGTLRCAPTPALATPGSWTCWTPTGSGCGRYRGRRPACWRRGLPTTGRPGPDPAGSVDCRAYTNRVLCSPDGWRTAQVTRTCIGTTETSSSRALAGAPFAAAESACNRRGRPPAAVTTGRRRRPSVAGVRVRTRRRGGSRTPGTRRRITRPHRFIRTERAQIDLSVPVRDGVRSRSCPARASQLLPSIR